MRASAGAGNKESYEGGSSRTRVDFERGARWLQMEVFCVHILFELQSDGYSEQLLSLGP
jgi:hypothetical protein